MPDFQRLPSPAARYAAAHVFKPRLQDLAAYGADAPKVAEAMTVSLLASFAEMLEQPYSLPAHLINDPLVGPMLSFNLGRCLWTWEDVGATEPPATMKLWALRPSGMLPIDLQEVSPRLVVDMFGTFAAVERTAAAWATGPATDRLDLRLGLTDYGIPLPRLVRCPPAAEKVSIFGSRHMTMHEAPGKFADHIARNTLYRANLGEKLRNLQEVICQDAFEVITGPDAPEAQAEELGIAELLKSELQKQYLTTVDDLMVRPWNLSLDSGLAEYEYAPVIRRLLVARLHVAAMAVVPAHTLLAMAYMIGISPASFVRHAIKDVKRRGLTYMTGYTVVKLAKLVRAESSSMPAQALAAELDRLGDELLDALSVENPTVRMLERGSKRNVFPEWGQGGKRAAKALRAERAASRSSRPARAPGDDDDYLQDDDD